MKNAVVRLHASGEPAGRQALVQAALKLFAERGFAGASIRDLAAEAGVSIGLVRTHFGSKDGLLEAVDAHALAAVEELYDGVLTAPAPMTLHSVVDVAVAWVAGNRQVMLYVQTALSSGTPGSQALFDSLFSAMRRFVDAAAERRMLQEDVDRDMAALYLFYDFIGPALVAPYARGIFSRQPFSAAAVARRNEFMSRLFSRGIFR
jgi:AcrR family transcriptional regulator